MTTENISEPVLSFVNTVRNNPKRFKYKHLLQVTYSGVSVVHSFTDTLLNKEYHLWRRNYYYYIEGIDFLTKEEKEYLVNQITDIYKDRKKRLQELKQTRTKLNENKQRQEYIDLYCKE